MGAKAQVLTTFHNSQKFKEVIRLWFSAFVERGEFQEFPRDHIETYRYLITFFDEINSIPGSTI